MRSPSLKSIFASLVGYLLITLIFGSGTATWAINKDDFRVNSDGGKSEQNHPRVALRPGGGFVVVWTDYRYGQADIFCQFFDANANPTGTNRRLNTDTISAVQLDPVLAVASNGRTHVFWSDYRQSGYPFDPDIAGQSLLPSGDPSGVNRIITNEEPDSLKSSPDVAINPVTGEIIVVWEDYRNLHWDIYAQTISADGALVGGNRRLNDDPGSAQQHSPRIDCSPSGWYVVVWYDNRQSNDDIYGQIFRPDHSLIRANFKINSGGITARQVFPDVACDATGRFTVAWVDYRDGVYPKNPNIYARRFDTNQLPFSADQKLNTDNGEQAQRDVCIAADPRGNVAVVWSDSTERQWDLTGQMLTVDGQIEEQNFLGHVLRDSMQLRPDVALDGNSRYLVWMDSRNGNWDIYGRIVEYNHPKLALSVSSLQFDRTVGSPDAPRPQNLIVNHQGYNPIRYRIDHLPSWLRLNGSPDTLRGLTPDSISVSIVDTGLASGTYSGLLRFIDYDNADSSTSLSVTYRIGTPVVHISLDTIIIQSVPHLTTTLTSRLAISNLGIGQLQWTSQSSQNWCTTDPVSGSAGDISVNVDPSSFDSGQYVAALEFASKGTQPSRDTLIVIVNVLAQPYVQLSPHSFSVVESTLDTTGFPLSISNRGVGTLSARLVSTVPWISLADSLGTDGSIILAKVIGFNMLPGEYNGWIVATDSLALNRADSCHVSMHVYFPGKDTLFISDLSVGHMQSGMTSLICRTTDSVTGFDFPLLFPSNSVHLDSLKWLLPDWTVLPSYDSATEKLQLFGRSSAQPLPPGMHELARIFLTGGDLDTTCSITFDPSFGYPLRAIRTKGDTVPVQLSGGTIAVQTGTGVGDDEPLPSTFFLNQNYPNPFNPSTTIRFGLSGRSQVLLTVHNLLGQAVGVLVDQPMASGVYEVLLSESSLGHPLASGIYFARLTASPMGQASDRGGSFEQTIKLLLLK